MTTVLCLLPDSTPFIYEYINQINHSVWIECKWNTSAKISAVTTQIKKIMEYFFFDSLRTTMNDYYNIKYWRLSWWFIQNSKLKYFISNYCKLFHQITASKRSTTQFQFEFWQIIPSILKDQILHDALNYAAVPV